MAGNGWTVFQRSDGNLQLAYNGWPLYTYSGDSASGQTNGNGITSFGGVWTIARPNMANAPGVPAPTAPPNVNGGY
jgi:predicted lipoprotein with Yx(FWY)xxD motif